MFHPLWGGGIFLHLVTFSVNSVLKYFFENTDRLIVNGINVSCIVASIEKKRGTPNPYSKMGNTRGRKKYLLNNKSRSACSLNYAVIRKWQNIASECLIKYLYCYFSRVVFVMTLYVGGSVKYAFVSIAEIDRQTYSTYRLNK